MNLFDVTRGFKGNKGDKPRTATHDEIFAYAHWLRTSRGLPNFPGATLRWRSQARGADLVCVAVTFGGDKETGAYSLLLPGYASHRDRVTFETVDDSGEVGTSQTLPVEPKKGGVIWDKAAVHKACGPVAKPAKGKRAKIADPIPVAAPAPAAVEPQEVPAPTCDKPEMVETLPVAPAVDLDAITARLEALEQALATLSAVSAASGSAASNEGAKAEATPTARAKRTPAHERAIRRAWAERKARRYAQSVAEQAERYARGADAKAERTARDHANHVAALEQSIADWEEFQHRTWTESMGHKVKRKRAAATARRMIAAARAQADLKGRSLDIANATIAQMKRDMADPTTPDRASDVARLVRERDEARTALAAVTERAKRAEQGLESMADKFTGLVSRVTRAEAALRASQAA